MMSIGWSKVGDLEFAKVIKDSDAIMKLSRCDVIDDTMQWHVQVTLCTSHNTAGLISVSSVGGWQETDVISAYFQPGPSSPYISC